MGILKTDAPPTGGAPDTGGGGGVGGALKPSRVFEDYHYVLRLRFGGDAWEWSQWLGSELGGYPWIAPSQWESWDVEYLMGTGRLASVVSDLGSQVLVSGPGGAWEPLTASQEGRTRSYVVRMLADAPHRRGFRPYFTVDHRHTEPVQPPVGFRHYQAVIGALLQRQTDDRIPVLAPDDLNRCQRNGDPVLPLRGGGALRIRDGERIDAADLRERLVEAHWQIPDTDLLDVGEDYWETLRLTDDGLDIVMRLVRPDSPNRVLLELIAYGLARAPKGIGIVAWDESNVGKSSVGQMARKALPGAVVHKPSVKSLSTTNGFNPEMVALSRSLVVIYDEMDAEKTAHIANHDLESMVAELCQIHLKFENSRWATRTGFAIMLCNKPPPLPYGATGVVGTDEFPGRADWAPVVLPAPEAGEPESEKLRSSQHLAAMESESGIAYIRWLLIRLAQNHLMSDVSFESGASDYACSLVLKGRVVLQRLQAEARDHAAGVDTSALDALIARAQRGASIDRIWQSDVRAALDVPEGGQMPRGFMVRMKARFPEVDPRDMRWMTFSLNGKQAPALRGFTLAPEPEPEPELTQDTGGCG